jgi:hypothetical protein
MASLLFPNFVLQNLGFDLEICEFFPQSLVLNPQLLPFLLTSLDLLLHHHTSLDGDIVL